MAKTAPSSNTSSLSPAAVEATLKLALARHQAGQLALAEALYDQVLLLDPVNLDALHLKGVLSLAQGSALEALTTLERVCTLMPTSALFHRSRSEALVALGRWQDACHALRNAIDIKPDWAEAYAALGIAQAALGKPGGAKAAFARATELDPGLAEAWNNLGVLHLADKDADAARAAFEAALNGRPGFLAALNGLGVAQTETGHAVDAVATFNQALATSALDARMKAEILMNRAVALDVIGHWEEELSDLRTATELSPDLAGAWRNMAKPLVALGQLGEAEKVCTRALMFGSEGDAARYERAFVRLLAGNFVGGFEDYLARPTVDRSRYPAPTEPLPANLAGRRFRLIAEQGLGEHMFFLRYATTLIGRGAEIAIEIDPKLNDVLKGHPSLRRLVGMDEPTPGFEFVLMGDLPFLVGGSDAPPSLALSPDSALADEMRARLAALAPPPYCALTWRAGIQDGKSLSKLIPLESLAKALHGSRATLISIQRGPVAGETERLARLVGRPIHDLSALNADLARMLALLSLVEDYAGVSNTNMHLRVALARPARVLVPHPPEFRWLASRERSPWFPSFALYRAEAAGWNRAIAQLAADLAR